MSTAAPSIITKLPDLYFSENCEPFGAQPQAQLQYRRLENEEAAVEPVGFAVGGICCAAGQSHTQFLCNCSGSKHHDSNTLNVFLSQLFEEERVIPALLTLMKPPTASSERRSGSGRWSSAQQEELQLQALTILATIAPLMLEEYVSCQGIACLLLLLDWCVRKGEDAPKHYERQIKDWRDSIMCLKCQRSNTDIHVSCQTALEQNRVLVHSLFFPQLLVLFCPFVQMLSLVTAPMVQEEEAVKPLRCFTVSEFWDLWRLHVWTQSTRTFVIKESSTSSWVS